MQFRSTSRRDDMISFCYLFFTVLNKNRFPFDNASDQLDIVSKLKYSLSREDTSLLCYKHTCVDRV